MTGHRASLDQKRDHAWWAIAPVGAIDVAFESPSVRFRGLGYHDANFGVEGLEEGFRSWNWSRASTATGACLTYDAIDLAGNPTSATLSVNEHGELVPRATPEMLAPRMLPRSSWGLSRFARSEAPSFLRRSLEDGPFYARALIQTSHDRKVALAMHEVLDATRLSKSWVRFLAPFRMGRAC